MSKAKRWCFTSYNVDNEPSFDPGVHEYLVYGRETCPDTSRKHLQGFVCFKNRTTLAGCKRFIPGAHFERARGTPQEASDYCKKESDFSENGSLPTTTGRSGGLGDLLAKAKEGDITYIEANYPGMFLRYKAAILSSIEFDTSQLNNSCGVWICGPPRSGKDYGVRRLGDVYVKGLNKWWDGYRNQKYVLISDIEPSHASWLGYFLKIWCDCYAFSAEIKGGTMMIRPKKIFCTSNFKLEDVFHNEILEALQARMNVYDLFSDQPTVRKRMCVRPTEVVFDLVVANEEDVSPPPPVQASTEEETDTVPEETHLSPHETSEPVNAGSAE